MNDLASLIYGSQGMPPAQPYPVAPVPQPAGMPLPEAAVPVVQNVAAPVVQAAPQAAPALPPTTSIDANSSPEERGGFMERMRTDPNLRQSILMTGLTMMQPRHGEDTMGLVGRSIMAGNMTKNFLDQNAVENERADVKLKSETDYRDAQMKATTQKTEQDAALFPQTKRKLELDVDNAVTDGQKKRAEAAMKEFESNPKRMAEKYDLDRSATRASINRDNAAAGASGAASRASNALTDERKFGLGIKQEAFSDKTTPERKATIRQGYTMDDQTANAVADREARTKALIKEANPDWTDQQIATRALEMVDPTNMKGQEFQTLRELLRNAETDSEIKEIKGKMNALLAKAESSRNPQGAAAPATATAAPAPSAPPMGSRVVGKTTWTNPNGVTGVWNGTGWDVKK